MNLFVSVGGNHLLRCMNSTPRILFWHGVDTPCNSEIEAEIINTKEFIRQIDYIKKYYEIISIEEFEKRFKTNSFNGKEIVLTFDDGYANNLYVVAEILTKQNLPFTVFVSTEHIDAGIYFPTSVNRILTGDKSITKISIPSKNILFDLANEEQRKNACSKISDILKTSPLNEVKQITQELINNVSTEQWNILKKKYKTVRPMTWDEVKLLSNMGATIGSHCKWHTCCHSNQNLTDIIEELIDSKKEIEERLSTECKYFAYPNGDFTTASNDIVNSTYTMGFSTKRKERVDYKNNTAVIPRIGMSNNYTTFKLMISLYPNK